MIGADDSCLPVDPTMFDRATQTKLFYGKAGIGEIDELVFRDGRDSIALLCLGDRHAFGGESR